MSIAVISDIHGNVSALEAVLDDISRRRIDKIVNLGDCLSGPFDGRATADLLMGLDLLTVRGNHDRQLFDRPRDKMGLWEDWIVDDLAPVHMDWLRSMPAVAQIDGAFLCHGTPNSDEDNWLDERTDRHLLVQQPLAEVELKAAGLEYGMMLCGHTHQPRIARLPDGRVIVNPGSVGCPAYHDTSVTPSFIQQIGAPDARYAIIEQCEGLWKADLIAVPYDPAPMARLAKARGADSWVQAITSGWFL